MLWSFFWEGGVRHHRPTLANVIDRDVEGANDGGVGRELSVFAGKTCLQTLLASSQSILL